MLIKALSFTGHRPQSLPFSLEHMNAGFARMEMRISDVIFRMAEQGCEEFICGCALGCDIVFGEAVVAAREDKFSNIKLICAVPFSGQDNKWPAFWREKYAQLLANADKKVLISQRYHSGCYHERNRFMVDSSQALLAVLVPGSAGGTAYTVNYAREKGKQVIVIEP